MAAWEILGCLTNGGTLVIREKNYPRNHSESWMDAVFTLTVSSPIYSSSIKRHWLHQWIKHPLVMPYNRLAVAVFAFNIFIFLKLFGNFPQIITVDQLGLLVLVNFLVALLIRQQYVVNLLFKIATAAPLSWPLHVRWALGKVYHFGGIHVGAFFSGSLWVFILSLKIIMRPDLNVLIKSIFTLHSLILLNQIVISLPPLRAKYHNQFELVGRFGSWTSLLLFWLQAYLLKSEYQVWIVCGLCILTVNAILPWLRLKKVPVKICTPSNHAALSDFNYGVTPFAGSSTDLSLNPLTEWHSFANVPYPGQEGFRLTISRAGDWTGKWIDERPKHVWVKGIPTAGVGNIETLFKKVIWVATGSGIGPCLPHILAAKVPSRLVWSTRTPHQTYGEDLTNEILKAQPNAIIWDTIKMGKPDLFQMALKAYQDFGAEAIICISNKKVTWDIVYQFESRGIPAFGAIWDS